MATSQQIVNQIARSTIVNTVGRSIIVNSAKQGPSGAASGGVADGDKGQITVASSGAAWTINNGVITNAMVASNAAIAYSKLAALTASRALVSDGSGVVSVSAITSTELGYLSGVTSAIQTQLDGKSSTSHNHSGTYEPANANIQAHIASTSNPHSVTKAQVGLGSVENTALSTWAGSTAITTLGTIATGAWQGTAIADTYIASAATWNAKVGTGAITGSGLTMATARILGRSTASTGAVEEITIGSGLSLSAGTLSATATGVDLAANYAWTGTHTITASNAAAYAVGPNGNTNPSLRVKTNTASAATGIEIEGKAAGMGACLTAISSGTNENLTLVAKGTGVVVVPDTGVQFSGQANPAISRSGNSVVFKSNAGTLADFGSNLYVFGQWSGSISKVIKAATAGSGNTNRAGDNLVLSPGESTGNGVAGRIVLRAGENGAASGTAERALLDRLTVGAFKALSNSTTTALVNSTLASNTVAAGMIDYAVEVFDGTELQVETGRVYYSVTNKGGVIANNTATKSGNQQAATSGTLAVTFTLTAANPAVLQINANSSLTPSTGYPRVTYSLQNLTQQAVAIQ